MVISVEELMNILNDAVEMSYEITFNGDFCLVGRNNCLRGTENLVNLNKYSLIYLTDNEVYLYESNELKKDESKMTPDTIVIYHPVSLFDIIKSPHGVADAKEVEKTI